MLHEPSSSASDRSELTSIIRDIRKRWRLKLAVRGAMFVVAGFILTLLLSAYALETLKFSPGSIIAFRVGMVMIFGALAGYFFVHAAVAPRHRRAGCALSRRMRAHARDGNPQRARSREGIALPFSGACSPTGRAGHRALRVIERGRRLEAQPLRRYAAVIGGTVAAALLIFLLGPAYMRQGASALLLMAGDVLEASPYRIDVTPGNTTVPRGSDQVIKATVQGFESDKAELLIRKSVKRAVRTRADGLQQRHEDLRRNALRSAGLDRLLRRVGRREVVGVHDARRRSAVRETARDGVRVSLRTRVSRRARSRMAAISRCCRARKCGCASPRRWHRPRGAFSWMAARSSH